jgi:hypothetical protein
MKLDIKAMICSLAVFWGAVVFFTGAANLIWTGYGGEFLRLLASIYPGYKASGSGGDFIVGVLYALVDGALFGLVFAWLYNRFLGTRATHQSVGDLKRQAGVRYPPVEP